MQRSKLDPLVGVVCAFLRYQGLQILVKYLVFLVGQVLEAAEGLLELLPLELVAQVADLVLGELTDATGSSDAPNTIRALLKRYGKAFWRYTEDQEKADTSSFDGIL